MSASVENLDEKIVAYLHDVVEKGKGWNLKRLENAGFSPTIVSAVDALTRRKGEDDKTFIRRAIANPLARPVKRADLVDNRRQASVMGVPTTRYDEGLAILAEELGRAPDNDRA